MITFLVGAAVSAAGLAMIWPLPDLVADAYLMPVWLCLFCVPLFALSEVNEGISRAHGWMNTALVPTYILRPSILVIGCFLAVLVGFELKASVAMSMAIAAGLITIVSRRWCFLSDSRRSAGSSTVRVPQRR